MSAWRKRSHTYPGRLTPEVWYERDVPEEPGTIQCISPELFYELERDGGRERTEFPLMRTAPDPIRSGVRSTATSPRRKPTSTLIDEAKAEAAQLHAEREVPELRPNAKPTVTVTLSTLARETIHDELAFSRRFIEQELGETGGWLFGTREGPKWLLSATNLGAGERRSKSVVISFEQARHETYRANLAGNGIWRKCLGTWHVHPVIGYTEPSGEDRKNALRLLEEDIELNRADFALDIIVSPHADRGWNSPQFHAWATRRDRWAGAITEPATIEGKTATVNWYME
jgi:hypothetical protein